MIGGWFQALHKQGSVQHTRFANTMIRSIARLTYQQADKVLKGDVVVEERDSRPY